MTDTAGPSRPRTVAAALQDSTIRKVAQNFYTKASLIVASSRSSLPQSFDKNEIKVDKWFGITLDDSDILKEELAHWSSLGLKHATPSPLFIEVYLDSAELTRNDTIVIKDERGKRWDACEALDAPPSTAVPARGHRRKATRIVLERWKIDLVDDMGAIEESRQESIAAVYKKAVVLFRSLYTFTRLMPAWDFSRRLDKEPATLTSLRPTYQIFRNDPTRRLADPLLTPLYPSAEPATDRHVFHPISTPAGTMNIEVMFRRNCDFRIDDAEALMSARFMGMDVQDASAQDDFPHRKAYTNQGKEIGSLPSDRRPPLGVLGRDQAYGSMSTFHQVGGRMGTSPISALRAAGELNVESPTEESPRKIPPEQASSFKSTTQIPPSVPRRVSVSIQPFKAGSLASSPGRMPATPSSPRPPTADAPASPSVPHSRELSSNSNTTQASLKPSAANDIAVGSPGSASPKAPPITRYSSSFGHRRSRFSSGGGSGSKMDEVGASSGKGSQSSSNQPGSGLLAEGETSEPGSIETDDTQISDFLKLLESKKELKSFNNTDEASKEATARRTNAALNKYRNLRDSHTALSDSLSSSMLGQSPGGSSRQPGSVPPMLAGASVSTSSSPGKPISPHTPHTPAVPSRLSAQANLDEGDGRHNRSGARREAFPGDAASPDTPSTGAIDIPTSPQRYPHIRRPSSAVNRARVIEDEFGMRTSTSVPPSFDNREGADLSLSELFALNEPPAPRRPTVDEEAGIKAREEQAASGAEAAGGSSNTPEGERPAPFFRSRLGRGGAAGRGSTSSTGTGGSGERSGRFSFSNRAGAANMDDEEPLVFTMSDMGHRRSVEEGEGESKSGRRGGWR